MAKFGLRDFAGDADEIGIGEINEILSHERKVRRHLSALIPPRRFGDLNDHLVPLFEIQLLGIRPSHGTVIF